MEVAQPVPLASRPDLPGRELENQLCAWALSTFCMLFNNQISIKKNDLTTLFQNRVFLRSECFLLSTSVRILLLLAETHLAVCEGVLYYIEHGGWQGADALQRHTLLQRADVPYTTRQSFQQLHHSLYGKK